MIYCAGKALAHALPYGKRTMTTAVCARLILADAAKRARDLRLSPRGGVTEWARLIARGFVDAGASRTSERGRCQLRVRLS